MYLIADQLGLRPGQPPLPIQALDALAGKAIVKAMATLTR
jgi:hypothetical protein